MKKRLAALVCALLLCFALTPTPAGAAWDDGLMFLAINVKMLPLAEYIPIKINGSIYVPISVFDASTNGGVSLGLFGGMNKGQNTYTLYNTNVKDPTVALKNLVFDLSTGLSYDYLPQDGGTQQDPQAAIRNGKVYVTAFAVCRYFGLDYTYRPSVAQYSYPMVRIKSRDTALPDDEAFINAASNAAMLTVLNDYYRAVVPQAPATTAAPVFTPPPQASPEPGDTDKSGVTFQLAFRCETGAAGGEILDALAADGRAAVLFFPPEALATQDDLVRRAMGEGHAVGILVPGESAQAAEEAIAEGNRLLAHVGRARTRMIFPAGADAATVQTLEDGGWLCWSGNIDGVPGARSGYGTAQEVLRRAGEEKRRVRVTMDDSTSAAAALPTILRMVREEKYNYRPTVETTI